MKPITLYYNYYTLLDQIASGGFATIYRAKAEDRAEEVAIKVASTPDDPNVSKSLREEARILERFTHKNIVQLQAIPRRDKGGTVGYANAVELPGHPVFFVMEYLQGGSLENYLTQVKKLTVTEAATIALEIARALDHMHRQDFAHNDLKLENIVFRQPVTAGKPFMPVLIDFGIATRVRQPNAGSLYIMPPEQVDNMEMRTAPEIKSALDRAKVDVWGLGVVMYRMLGGQTPFSGRNERSLTQRIRNSRPSSLSALSGDIPDEVDEMIIDGCLAKNPDHRIPLRDLGLWLRGLAGDGVVAQKSVELPKRSGGWFRRA